MKIYLKTWRENEKKREEKNIRKIKRKKKVRRNKANIKFYIQLEIHFISSSHYKNIISDICSIPNHSESMRTENDDAIRMEPLWKNHFLGQISNIAASKKESYNSYRVVGSYAFSRTNPNHGYDTQTLARTFYTWMTPLMKQLVAIQLQAGARK